MSDLCFNGQKLVIRPNQLKFIVLCFNTVGPRLGVEFHSKEQHKFAFLLATWRVLGIKKFFAEICYPLPKKTFPRTIVCGKTMI